MIVREKLRRGWGTPGEESGRNTHGETAGRRRRMEAQGAGLGMGKRIAAVHGQKLFAGQTDVAQQVIIFTFQQERSRAAQLQKGEEAGEHGFNSFA